MERDSQLPNTELEEWIKNTHPNHEVVYLGKTFTFDYDLPNEKLEKWVEYQGMERIYYYIAETSIDPKVSFEDVKAWPSTMTTFINAQLKKAIEISQRENTASTLSCESCTSPTVKSDIGA